LQQNLKRQYGDIFAGSLSTIHSIATYCYELISELAVIPQ